MNIHVDAILAVGVLLFYLLLWKVKSAQLRRLNIIAEVLPGVTSPTQRYFGRLERTMTIAVVLILLTGLFFDKGLLCERLFGADGYTVKSTGTILAVLGLTVCRIAQTTMGKSWRVGIDDATKPGLVTDGIYRLIRNPTYGGLYLVVIGVFLVLPTILMSYWCLAFFLMMEFQVRCEEEYLEREYGNEYLQYKRSAKRYIPYIY